MERAGGRDGWFVVELKLSQIVFGGSRVRLAILALVLALLGNSVKLLDVRGRDAGVANKFVYVAVVSAKVTPSNNLLRALANLYSQMKGFVEQESLLVTFGGKGVDLSVFSFFFCEQLCLPFFVDSLNDELILEVLSGAADLSGGVLEDELRVALGGEGSDEVELALRQVGQGFLVASSENEFANY